MDDCLNLKTKPWEEAEAETGIFFFLFFVSLSIQKKNILFAATFFFVLPVLGYGDLL